MPRAADKGQPVIAQVQTEELQGHATRVRLFKQIEAALGRPVVSFFTSFNFPVMLEDADADMLEGVFRKLDLSNGLALIVSSPGGDGLAAERIINLCRAYSGTGDYVAIVPSKAKSAATMVCFGASKIYMSASSELGPIDPQVAIGRRRFSAYNIVKSYRDLFERARKEPDNLEPYLQQLANYDAREIAELTSELDLSEDIAVRVLASGMMGGKSEKAISKQIKTFLTPERTKTHGRPIYRDEAAACGLDIASVEVTDALWERVYELYIRSNNVVQTNASKLVESKDHSYLAGVPDV